MKQFFNTILNSILAVSMSPMIIVIGVVLILIMSVLIRINPEVFGPITDVVVILLFVGAPIAVIVAFYNSIKSFFVNLFKKTKK